MPEPHASPEAFTHHVPPRLVIKFDDSIELPDAPGSPVAEFGETLLAPGWKDWQRRFPGLRNRRLLRRPFDDIRKVLEQAGPRFTKRRPQNLVVLDPPAGVSPKALLEFANTRAIRGTIEYAYLTPPPVPPPQAVAEGDLQTYLLPAVKGGIDARYAWTKPGGRGEKQAFYDVEWGWWLQHEDLRAHQATLVGGYDYSWFHHGTAVLGIVAAVENGTGCVGIAPGVDRVRCAGSWRAADGSDYDIADAIWDVIQDVVVQGRRGSVLLVEEQTEIDGRSGVPAEAIPAVLEMMQLATSVGIVVVAPAGNGGVNLDTLADAAGRLIFDPAAGEDADSGAILVGAATGAARSRHPDSCFGSRVNCFGWGENVYAPTTDAYRTTSNLYDDTLVGQTSSAAAMIAGVALVAQGLRVAATGQFLDSRTMRQVLGNSVAGTASASGADRIGVMPDLQKLLDGGTLLAAAGT